MRFTGPWIPRAAAFGIALGLVAALALGCERRREAPSPPEPAVVEPPGQPPEPEEPSPAAAALGLVGVGVAKGISNPALARQTASDRARADLAEKLRARGALGQGAPLRGAVITSVKFEASSRTARATAEIPR